MHPTVMAEVKAATVLDDLGSLNRAEFSIVRTIRNLLLLWDFLNSSKIS
jgi:hypothetical protein